MKKLGRIEIAAKKMEMRIRAALRLKANEQYLAELNEVLPEMMAKFWKHVQHGIVLEYTTADFMDIITGQATALPDRPTAAAQHGRVLLPKRKK